jgi:hypothetical protein
LEGLFPDHNASDGKKFCAPQKNSHCKKTTLWQHLPSSRRVDSTRNVLEAKNVEETLEVALRNADVVAGKN